MLFSFLSGRKDYFVPLIILTLLAFGSAGAAQEELQGVLALSNGQRIPLSEVPPMAGGAKDFQVYGGIEFTITYADPAGVGFNAPSPDGPLRQALLLSVLEYIADVLNQPGGKCDIEVQPSINVNSGTLAYAGPWVFWNVGASGVNNGATFNHLHDGASDPSPTYGDMRLTVNWYHNYYMGTGTPSGSQYDLYSILLHEMTHGLGYLCSIVYDDVTCSSGSRPRGSGWTGSQPDIYTSFDMMVETGNGHPFIGSSYTYVGASSYFLGGDGGVFSTASQAASVLGTQATIYAPPSYECGSSMSHWNYLGGVMDPSIMAGAMKREYTPFEIAFLRDIGYVNAAAAGTEPEGEGEGTAAEGEGEGVVEGEGEGVTPEGEGAVEGEGEGVVEGEGEVEPCGLLAPCPDFQAEGAALFAYLNTVLVEPVNWNTSDMDGSGIRDSWETAVFAAAACQPLVAVGKYATCVYASNLEELSGESSYATLAAFEHTLAALLTISSEMQGALLGPLGLTGSYDTAHDIAKASGEPFSAQGNPDRDAWNNLMEYENTMDAGLSRNDYVEAALNPMLDGTREKLEALPLGSPVWLAALAILAGAAGPLVIRRRKAKRSAD